ncbi:MAG: hypothetical protein AAFR93_16560 [Pseudomonadota bacterium]
MWWSSRQLLLAGACALFAACGFEPVYGPPAQDAALGPVTLIAPASQEGFAFRESFEARVPRGAGTAQRLEVSLSFKQRARVIQRDNSITRFNLTGTTKYTLLTEAGEVARTGSVQSTTEYSATANAFATQVAARSARDRLARDMGEKLALRLAALGAGS